MAEQTGKKWYASKTLWVNVIAIAALLVEKLMGTNLLTTEAQAGILAVINIVLRLITKEQVIWAILIIGTLTLSACATTLKCKDCPFDNPCPIGKDVNTKVDQYLMCVPERTYEESWNLIEKNPADGSSVGKYITIKRRK